MSAPTLAELVAEAAEQAGEAAKAYTVAQAKLEGLMLDQRRAGATIRDLAAASGYSVAGVHKMLRRHGLA